MQLSNENGSVDCSDHKPTCNSGKMLGFEAASDGSVDEVRPTAVVSIASTQLLIQDAQTRAQSVPSAGAKNARGVDLPCRDPSSATQLHLINPVSENVNRVATNGALAQHGAVESPPSTSLPMFSGAMKAGALSAGSVGVGGESVVIHTGSTPCLSPSNLMVSQSVLCPNRQSLAQFENLTRVRAVATDSKQFERVFPARTQQFVNDLEQKRSIQKTSPSESTASVLSVRGKDSCSDSPLVSLAPVTFGPDRIEPSTRFVHLEKSTNPARADQKKLLCFQTKSQSQTGDGDGDASRVGQAVVTPGTNLNSLLLLGECRAGGSDAGPSDAAEVNVCPNSLRALSSKPAKQTANLKSETSNMVLLPVPSPLQHSTSHVVQTDSFNLNQTGLVQARHACSSTGSQSFDQDSVALPHPRSSCELPAPSTPQASLSADAQTDTSDLVSSILIAPPPSISRNNREQRKRERRERRRDRSQATLLNPGDEARAGLPCRNQDNVRTIQPSCASSGVLNSTHLLIPHKNQVTATPQALVTDCSQSISQDEQGPASAAPATSDSNATQLEHASSTYPDLLNAHFPPPYSTLPPGSERRHVGSLNSQGALQLPVVTMPVVTALPPPPHTAHMQIPLPLAPPPPTPILVHTPPNCLPPPAQPTIRYHFSPAVRASRRSLRASRGVSYASEDEPKSCCGMSTSQAVSIRWFIIIIAVIGISCTVAGTALGAAYSNGREHLTLSLLMIGVGVVLLTVSAVAWRLTAHESGLSCRVMLGFSRRSASRGDGGTEPNRRFVPRLAPTYGRPHHPYAAMMYPEFHYRPPPPSYQASMQEYRLRLLLLERSNPTIAAAAALSSPTALTMVPPPPAYRPYNGTLRNSGNSRNEPDYSRPPSYRSRSSGNNAHGEPVGRNRPSLDPSAGHHLHHMMLESPLHSRDPSLLSYLSQQSLADNVSVVSGHALSGATNGTTAVVTVMQAVSVGMDLSLDMEMFPSSHHGENANKSSERHDARNLDDKGLVERFASNRVAKKGNQDGNLVRIVQTTDSSQVIRRDSVIVTVSGSNHNLWDQQLHHTNNQHNIHHLTHHHSSHVLGVHNGSSLGQMHADNQTNTSCTSQVQILAHL